MIDSQNYVICPACKQRFKVGEGYLIQAKGKSTGYELISHPLNRQSFKNPDTMIPHGTEIEVLDYFHTDCLQ